MGTLEVNIPPDILNDNDSTEGGVAVEGGTVRLKCHATGFPVPTVEWKREDGRHIMIRREGEPPKPGMTKPQLFAARNRGPFGLFFNIIL